MSKTPRDADVVVMSDETCVDDSYLAWCVSLGSDTASIHGGGLLAADVHCGPGVKSRELAHNVSDFVMYYFVLVDVCPVVDSVPSGNCSLDCEVWAEEPPSKLVVTSVNCSPSTGGNGREIKETLVNACYSGYAHMIEYNVPNRMLSVASNAVCDSTVYAGPLFVICAPEVVGVVVRSTIDVREGTESPSMFNCEASAVCDG